MQIQVIYNGANVKKTMSANFGMGGFDLVIWFRESIGQLGVLPRIRVTSGAGANLTADRMGFITDWINVKKPNMNNVKKLIGYANAPKNKQPLIHINATLQGSSCWAVVGDCRAKLTIIAKEDWPHRKDDDNLQGDSMLLLDTENIKVKHQGDYRILRPGGTAQIYRNIWSIDKAPYSPRHDGK